ncbi:hypothetical protein C8A01DRAFT_14674 [Parachaetomium inaequale]|uniref:Uncharacterized protein n=1 Tax=Parachaetomium inaequale TaxID=2588326 RepID=A0AAN6PM31_9PEZI|nr:hypothetical protein C8A01DRAFT_14674 [Parachaetomium inaequale]
MSHSEYAHMPPSLRKRFYEPVILLNALRSVYLKDNRISEPDLEGSQGKSPKETYFCFLNKLSQICDSQPKQPLGKTVSAIVALDSGTIEFRLASNQRDSRELDTVREYLTDILEVLGRVTDHEVNDKAFMGTVFSGILQKVLAFNRPRVEDYMAALVPANRLPFCIEYSAADGTSEGKIAADALRSLQPHLEAAVDKPRLNDDEFARHTEALLQTINQHYESSPLEEYMKQKTRGHNNADSPWSEVRHALGRLLSYFIAIKVLISARKFWPRLFVDFEVTSIPSSEPLADPPAIRRNAKGIISRMSRNKATLDAYQRHAAHLQAHHLDERIRDHVHPSRFRPIVHAEVNLLASVLRSQAAAEHEGEDPLRFFNEAEFGAYIGSSKPTCFLCRAYFAKHPSGVGCRATHGNLYGNWRAPEADTDEGAAEQREILEGMVKEVRNEAGRAIRERSYTRRKHDSRDTPSNPLGSTTVGDTSVGRWEDLDELASRMGQVSLDVSSTRGWSDDSRETSPDSPGHGEDNDEEDDDGGGAKL